VRSLSNTAICNVTAYTWHRQGCAGPRTVAPEFPGVLRQHLDQGLALQPAQRNALALHIDNRQLHPACVQSVCRTSATSQRRPPCSSTSPLQQASSTQHCHALDKMLPLSQVRSLKAMLRRAPCLARVPGLPACHLKRRGLCAHAVSLAAVSFAQWSSRKVAHFVKDAGRMLQRVRPWRGIHFLEVGSRREPPRQRGPQPRRGAAH